ncbi:MAG: nucleotidyltransferase family protein [Rhizobiaceae bacterium]
MKLTEALETLKSAEISLRAKGVQHAGIFGSTARGDARTDSDVDVLIDFDPDAPITIYDYVSVKNDIEDLFGVKVDVVDSEGLKPNLRNSVVRDLVYAF